jgi:hypothetical protein
MVWSWVEFRVRFTVTVTVMVRLGLGLLLDLGVSIRVCVKFRGIRGTVSFSPRSWFRLRVRFNDRVRLRLD